MATLNIPPPIPTSLPKSRKSLSALAPSSSLLQPPHPTLHRSESDDVNAARNTNVIKQKMGRRAMSIGGNAMVAGIVTDPTVKGLSPRSFRRVAKPRKSILKPISLHSPRRSPLANPTSRRRTSLTSSQSQSQSQSQTTPSKSKPIRSHASPLAGLTIDYGQLSRKPEDGFETDDSDSPSSFPPRLGGGTDHTLPASFYRQKSTTTPSPSSKALSEKEAKKAARRAFLASRKSVSFAPHAHVRMFDTVVAGETPAGPEGGKVFGAAGTAAVINAGGAAKLGLPPASATPIDMLPSTATDGQKLEGGSRRRHGRQNSIGSLNDLPAPPASSGSGSTGTEERASRRRSAAGVGEVGDESGMSMDIETDSEQSVDEDEQEEQADQDEDEDEQEDDQEEGETMDFTTVAPPSFLLSQTLPQNISSIFSSIPDQPAPSMDLPRFSVRRDLGSKGYSAFSPSLGLGGGEEMTTSSVFTVPESPRVVHVRSIGGASATDDMTMDMDMTQVMGNGHLLASPASTVSARDDDEEEEEEESSDEEVENAANRGPEERTMDFTVAVGGIIPGLPPVNAWRSAESIGYTSVLPDGYEPTGINSSNVFSASTLGNPFLDGSSGEGSVFTLPRLNVGDESLEMDETIALGGIVREDQTISSVDEDEGEMRREPTLSFPSGPFTALETGEGEMTMDFTMARGGILSNASPRQSTGGVFSMNVTSPTASTVSKRTVTSSVFSVPASPEQAQRATTSVRRDIYGPSPDAIKSSRLARNEDEPVGRSMEAAKDVAKKLVFTPTKSTSPSPRKVSPVKRMFESALDKVDANKSMRTSPADKENTDPSPFQPVAQSPRKYGSPLKERPRTPNKRFSVLGPPERSPHKNLAPLSPARRMASLASRPTTPSRLSQTEVMPEPEWAQQEFSSISLGNFLEMTGIQFMTSMPTATRRKSVLNGGMPAEYMQRMMTSENGDYPLYEYAAAMNAWFYYKMYHWACQQMQQDIETTQENVDELNRDASVDNPMIMREYLAASDDEKALFEEMLQNLKTNAHLIAKEKWYKWRCQLTTGVKQQIEAMNVNLKEDKRRVDATRQQAADSLPILRDRRMELQKELAREKASIEAVTQCDQVELRDLKAAISEQAAQIASFAAEYNELNEKLGQLKGRLEEHQAEKYEIGIALAAAKRECEQRKGFTKSEAFALEKELKALQTFNSWKLEKLQADTIEMVYDDEIRLKATCTDYRPVASSSKLTLSGNDAAPSTRAFFELVEGVVEKRKAKMDLQQIVQLVGRLWTAVQKLRAEFKTIGLRYPTTYRFVQEKKTFESRSRMLLPASRSKVEVCFLVGEETLVGWPESVNRVGVQVDKIYGSVSPEELKEVIQERIESATASACLLAFSQCCVDVESL